jgi:hypothetical protein
MGLELNSKKMERVRTTIEKFCKHECMATHPTEGPLFKKWIPCIFFPQAVAVDDISTYHTIRGSRYAQYGLIIPATQEQRTDAILIGSSIAFYVRSKYDLDNQDNKCKDRVWHMQASSDPVLYPSHIEYIVSSV